MSARQRQQPSAAARLSVPEWSGSLSCTDAIVGHLICSSTGWRLAVTGTPDGARLVHLTAKFDSPVFADDAFPGAVEGNLAVPHEAQAAGYLCHWTGSIRTDDGKAWAGEIADQYGGRLVLTGKAHGGGVTSLRVVARVAIGWTCDQRLCQTFT